MTAAAAGPWYVDWPKFLPGWIALVITGGTWARKAWTRRHQLALGPDEDAVREQLKELRDVFEWVVTWYGREWHQFKDGKARGAAREVVELAERRTDKVLKRDMLKVAEAMDMVITSAPNELGNWAEHSEVPQTPEQDAEWTAYEEKRGKQLAAARNGVEHATSAITRLNKLERRIHGRS